MSKILENINDVVERQACDGQKLEKLNYESAFKTFARLTANFLRESD